MALKIGQDYLSLLRKRQQKKENREEILCAIGFVILIAIVWLGISLAAV